MKDGLDMSQTIVVNKDLEIDLLPGVGDSEPALCLHTRHDPAQSLIVFASEIHLLRDALAAAGVQLIEIEAEIKRKKISDYDCEVHTRPLIEARAAKARPSR